jgi:ketosteroid isomerase-like protein
MAEEPTMPDLERLRRWMTVGVGDPRDSESEMSLFAPDAVWDMSHGGAEVIEGYEAIRAFFDQWLEAYEQYGQEVEEIQDLGNGVAFAVLLQRARPTGSGAWVEFRDARVLLFADGLVERVNAFVDIDEARAAAARLAEERRSPAS